ncbi:MAG: HlyD family efflux transporter periplasmic adaptor subunit [bacterium]|nr:HlyD family efflux transporter periplasmic adaptor subunit [bacterium]
MTKRRILLLLVLVLLVLGATLGVTGIKTFGSLNDKSSVPVYEVRRSDFTRRVRAEGNLEAANATLLAPPQLRIGRLRIAWLETDGTQVSEGDVVIRFDPTEMESNLADGETEQATTDARIRQKKVREDGAMKNLGRDADMAELQLDYAREFKSKDDVIFSRFEIISADIDEELASEKKEHAHEVRGIKEELTQVELDLLAIERRKADLKIQESEEGLQALEVEAPHGGIFTLKEIWGRLPEVGTTVWSGNPVAEIPQLDVMQAKIFVLEADAGGLETGLEANVTLDAHPDRVYKATVKSVDALAKPRFHRIPVQYFSAILELERTDPDVMKPGQRVQAVLTFDEEQDALSIPRQAVFEKDGSKIVYVRRAGEFAAVDIELGPAALGLVVIESGIGEGDLVALRDPTRPLAGSSGEPAENGGGPSVGGSL